MQASVSPYYSDPHLGLGQNPEGSRRQISTWTPAEGADPELGLLNLGLGSTISNLRESIW